MLVALTGYAALGIQADCHTATPAKHTPNFVPLFLLTYLRKRPFRTVRRVRWRSAMLTRMRDLPGTF